jgi:hypothetical protein
MWGLHDCLRQNPFSMLILLGQISISITFLMIRSNIMSGRIMSMLWSWMWCPNLMLCPAMADMYRWSYQIQWQYSFTKVSIKQPVSPDCTHKVYTHSFNLRLSLTSWSHNEDTDSAPYRAPNPYLSLPCYSPQKILSPSFPSGSCSSCPWVPAYNPLHVFPPALFHSSTYYTYFSPSCSYFSRNKMLILRATELLFSLPTSFFWASWRKRLELYDFSPSLHQFLVFHMWFILFIVCFLVLSCLAHSSTLKIRQYVALKH